MEKPAWQAWKHSLSSAGGRGRPVVVVEVTLIVSTVCWGTMVPSTSATLPMSCAGPAGRTEPREGTTGGAHQAA